MELKLTSCGELETHSKVGNDSEIVLKVSTGNYNFLHVHSGDGSLGTAMMSRDELTELYHTLGELLEMTKLN